MTGEESPSHLKTNVTGPRVHLGPPLRKGGCRRAGEVWAETQRHGENLGCAGQNPMEDGERVVKNIIKKK